MKDNIRFKYLPEKASVEIRAKLKATGKWTTFGFCHPATVALIRKDGIKAHLHLIQIP